METSNNKAHNPALYFIISGVALLIFGMFFGLIGAVQYLIPGWLKSLFSFEVIRPIHVSSLVFWIIIGAMGSVIAYLQEHIKNELPYPKLVRLQFIIFITTIIFILGSYAFEHFGGREYWAFDPKFALPILVVWILFIINFTKSLKTLKNQPVYIWMWITGLAFFLFTYLESNLWIFPYFSSNIVNDMTIQWKSYGSMVGSWNMLIYGCSMYLMQKISGDKQYAFSKMAFVLYFTGLFNLMFNWGHHLYTLPTAPYIKHIGYAVSMTELFILGRIIYKWKSTLSDAKKHFYKTSYKFLIAADLWVFLTLVLAIAMSVPAINLYTHGTHITVAHTMGATIGIDSFLLLAVLLDILGFNNRPEKHGLKGFSLGFNLANLSLIIFWLSLIMAGIMKSKWQLSPQNIPFSTMMIGLRPYFISFFIAGIGLFVGLLIVLFPISYIKNEE